MTNKPKLRTWEMQNKKERYNLTSYHGVTYGRKEENSNETHGSKTRGNLNFTLDMN